MKYLGAIVKRLVSLLHCVVCGLLHPGCFSFSLETVLAPSVSILITNKGKIKIGRKVGIRKATTISADGGSLQIGEKCFINCGCVIASHKSIQIGKGTRLGPNCMVFDHDYDFRSASGYAEGKHLVADVVIGENVWIGAGTIILRGTEIGNNSVIGAGCVIKGVYPANSLVIQKRDEKCETIRLREDK